MFIPLTGRSLMIASEEKRNDFYLIRFHNMMRVYSNAPYGGGIGYSIAYMNRHVPLDYCTDPDKEIREFLRMNSLEGDSITVTMTACDVGRYQKRTISGKGFTVEIMLTAGAGNSLSIGSTGRKSPGTVNIFVATDASLSDMASLNLFQDIVEAKAQAFNDAQIRDKDTGKVSPGTSTDTVSLFVGNKSRNFKYAGRLSDIGKLTSEGIYDALSLIISKPCL